MTEMAKKPAKASAAPKGSKTSLSSAAQEPPPTNTAKSGRFSPVWVAVYTAVIASVGAALLNVRVNPHAIAHARKIFFPVSASNFLLISHKSEGSALYEKGPHDVLFVAGWIVLLTSFQFVFQRLVLTHLSRFCKPQPSAKQEAQMAPEENTTLSPPKQFDTVRETHAGFVEAQAYKLAEQLYLFVYYCVSLAAGLKIYSESPYYPFVTVELWTDYPVNRLSGLTKTYYLISFAFWSQQLLQYLLFTNRDQRRKDHWQMTAHHFITCCLVGGSYLSHFTRVGNLVLIIMDTSDVFLTLAKSLKYFGKPFQGACDVAFGLFAASWVVTRHGFYLWVMYSIAYEAPLILYRDGILFDSWIFRDCKTIADAERPGEYFSIFVWSSYLAFFVVLQGLLIYWFVLIVKVLVKVIRGKGADDVREEGEEDDG